MEPWLWRFGCAAAASAGFARLPQGMYRRKERKCGAAVPLEGAALSLWGIALLSEKRKRGAAVPLEGAALSLWGIRPISEKEQVPPGKRTCGPFPIRNLFFF